MNEIDAVVHTNDVSIVCLTETWLDDDISDSYMSIPGYYLIRRDRTNIEKAHGGGVCVYISKTTYHGNKYSMKTI